MKAGSFSFTMRTATISQGGPPGRRVSTVTAAIIGVCIFSNAVAADNVRVSFIFAGANAAGNMADAYTILLKDFRYSMLMAKHRHVSADCRTQQSFFRMAICEKIWPEEAWQVDRFRKAILGDQDDTQRVRDRLSIPATTVDTSLSIDDLPEGGLNGEHDLSQKQREGICRSHSWDLLSAEHR